jgi:hypothetical protein
VRCFEARITTLFMTRFPQARLKEVKLKKKMQAKLAASGNDV